MTEPRDWAAFAGIDWGGSQHHVVHPRQQRLATDPAAGHPRRGRLAELDAALARHGAALPVAVERAEGLLVEHLQTRGHPVFPVSPRIAARARERYRVAAVKDDRFDAFVLADTLRHEHAHWRALAVSGMRRAGRLPSVMALAQTRLGVAVVLGALAAGASTVMIMRMLEKVLPPTTAAAVATVIFAAAAGVLAAVGLAEVRRALPLVPERALDELREEIREVVPG